jgi:undecaprenyl diphosphate synthase
LLVPNDKIRVFFSATLNGKNCVFLMHFSNEELSLALERPLPRHVAIIMDGNRRWMEKQFLGKATNPLGGHWAGAETLTKIVEAASDLGLKILTVFGFSTENWGRSQEEIDTLLLILETYLENNRQKMVDEGVRFHAIGDLTPFSENLKNTIEMTTQATERGSGIHFVVALNYGGRDEMLRVLMRLSEEMISGKLSREGVSEEIISKYLDTAPYGDPDLLIRTSGERRISNFLLWQLAYTEIYVTETLWPDFTARDLLKAVLDFQRRQRRRGK